MRRREFITTTAAVATGLMFGRPASAGDNPKKQNRPNILFIMTDQQHAGMMSCTGVPGAEVRGVHLRLPGYGNEGPTLEIFQYNLPEKRPATAINRPGLAHLAFEVDDVEAARNAVVAAGGRCAGELVTVEIRGAGTITLIYMTDPEGNIIELQKWA